MYSDHFVVRHWREEYEEEAFEQWVSELREHFPDEQVSLGLVFMSPRHFPHAREILEIIRIRAAVPVLAGCSSQWLIAADRELEDDPGIVLALYSLPGAELRPVRITGAEDEMPGAPKECKGWMVFANPLGFDGEALLRKWDKIHPGVPATGGLASAGFPPTKTQVYLNDDVFEDGAVAISIGGKVSLTCIVSQGCTPIGESWTITNAAGNHLHEIGGRPAYQVLAETFEALDEEAQAQTRGNLFVGLVMNEYQDDFHRGDFLIRNLLGADPGSGSLAIGAHPRMGQTIQFQRRDRKAATEDLLELLSRAKEKLAGRTILGGLLCCCNGRGSGLFGEADHDIRLIQQQLGPLGISGFFCNGEIGPVGERNFLHGYTASLGLFVSD